MTMTVTTYSGDRMIQRSMTSNRQLQK